MLKREDRSHWLEFLLVCAGIVVYLNSFSGTFLFDDRRHILSSILNPLEVHRHKPLLEILTGSRPFLNLTFALNHALGGLSPWGYHLVNLAIHLLAGWTLFEILRRTFLSERLKVRYGEKAEGFAFSIALLWLLHPLQTQSVTYIIQRAESLMGLFYFLSLYAVIRNWKARAIFFSALGMATKEVMVTAPVVVLLYDRIFLASSFSEIYKKRKFLYLGLFATWIILGLGSLWFFNLGQSVTVGFGLQNLSPLEYALNQSGVILHYLRLSFWPHPLVIDYQWPVARTFEAIFFPSFLMLAIFFLTLLALRFRPSLGFLGIWFFLILAPTSSIIPIKDLAFEHRMYLPLASVMTLTVMAGYEIFRIRFFLARATLLLLTLLFGILTYLRNQDYQSEIRIWQDTVKKRPMNWRAYGNLGTAFLKEGRAEEALSSYREALEIKAHYALAHYNIATILDGQKKLEEAAFHYQEALRIDPNFADAHSNLGTVLADQGKLEEAILHYLKTLDLNPTFAEGYYNLGNAYLKQGKFTEAIVQYSKALELKPDLRAARNSLQNALAQKKHSEES